MSHRERRFVPYIVNIVCYGALYGLMEIFHIPNFISTVIVSALLIQIVCALTNVWIKISTHAAASGGVIGMLMAFSLIFGFDATGWLCCAILLSGAVCSSRRSCPPPRRRAVRGSWHDLRLGRGVVCVNRRRSAPAR